jgi:hypothetical protein
LDKVFYRRGREDASPDNAPKHYVDDRVTDDNLFSPFFALFTKYTPAFLLGDHLLSLRMPALHTISSRRSFSIMVSHHLSCKPRLFPRGLFLGRLQDFQKRANCLERTEHLISIMKGRVNNAYSSSPAPTSGSTFSTLKKTRKRVFPSSFSEGYFLLRRE